MQTIDVVSVGVDYITLTATTKERSYCLSTEAHKLLREEIAGNNLQRPWGMKGYQGWSAGGVQWGERDDGCILRLSSTAAFSNWWDCYQVAENCSRVDLQITANVGPEPLKEVMRQFRSIKRFYKKLGQEEKVTIWRSGKEGITVYVGSRQSAVYLRIYNKHAETKDDRFKGCVRFEVELKDYAAKSAIESIVSSGLVSQRILSGVSAMVRDRGGLLPLEKNLRGFAVATPPKMASDCDRRLAWLRAQVRPSVKMLLDHGLEKELLESLGLSSESASIPTVPLAPWLAGVTSRGEKKDVCISSYLDG